jgi:hypothetical protein
MENCRIALRFLLLLLLFGCSKQQTSKQITLSSDFETLMGKGHERWQYIQTQEDFANLAFFKRNYTEHIPLLGHGASHIPKTLHFIWIGPKPFPRESIENIRTWVAHHPDWTLKFWTDRSRPLPHPAMEPVLIAESDLPNLYPLYLQSSNYGEKSDLLRLEILFREGGVYVDHDVKCFKSFDRFNCFDFYCGMELPYKTCLSSSVLPTNNLVGSRKEHPILRTCMQWLLGHWEEIESDYPGSDRDSLINRVAHRTFFAFGHSFKEVAGQNGSHDIALPAFFFNAPDEQSALFARHQYAGKWFEPESEFEKVVKKRLMMLSKKTNKLLLFSAVLLGLNLLLLALLLWQKIAKGWKTARAESIHL